MRNDIQLIIGTIILMGIITGYTVYNDYQINHSQKSGIIKEYNLEIPKVDDVIVYTKDK